MSRFGKCFLAILAFMYGSANSIGSAQPGRELALVLGQTKAIEGTELKIQFTAVLEDSRCPVDAYCIWAGNGQVELAILAGDGSIKTLLLNTNEEPHAATIAGINLRLIALNPKRHEGIVLTPADYSITLRIEK